MKVLPKRKRSRLIGYNYATVGGYFITICTKDKKHLFGKIVDNKMVLNEIGNVVFQEMLNIELHYENIKIEKFVVMPNHVHALILINPIKTERTNPVKTERINPFPTTEAGVGGICKAGDNSKPPTIKCDLSNVVGKFKAAATRNIRKNYKCTMTNGIWQTSFHDHIIRNEEDYNNVFAYIENNPMLWEKDCFYK